MKNIDFGEILCLFLEILFFGLILFTAVNTIINDLSHPQTFDATLVDKVIDNGYVYFVFQRDGASEPEIFENKDNLIYGKFNSADLLMQLQVGKKYHLFTVGLRRPMWSSFINIISAEEIQ